MRTVTRNLILAILAVVVFLLALGALPGLLGSGDPYYVTATPADSMPEGATTANETIEAETTPNETATANGSRAAVDAANLSELSYPYTTAALANASGNESGRSAPYRRGPVGFKEAFTHSPFDELDALRQQYPNATVDDGVRVARNGTLYRVAVTR